MKKYALIIGGATITGNTVQEPDQTEGELNTEEEDEASSQSSSKKMILICGAIVAVAGGISGILTSVFECSFCETN